MPWNKYLNFLIKKNKLKLENTNHKKESDGVSKEGNQKGRRDKDLKIKRIDQYSAELKRQRRLKLTFLKLCYNSSYTQAIVQSILSQNEELLLPTSQEEMILELDTGISAKEINLDPYFLDVLQEGDFLNEDYAPASFKIIKFDTLRYWYLFLPLNAISNIFHTENSRELDFSIKVPLKNDESIHLVTYSDFVYDVFVTISQTSKRNILNNNHFKLLALPKNKTSKDAYLAISSAYRNFLEHLANENNTISRNQFKQVVKDELKESKLQNRKPNKNIVHSALKDFTNEKESSRQDVQIKEDVTDFFIVNNAGASFVISFLDVLTLNSCNQAIHRPDYFADLDFYANAINLQLYGVEISNFYSYSDLNQYADLDSYTNLQQEASNNLFYSIKYGWKDLKKLNNTQNENEELKKDLRQNEENKEERKQQHFSIRRR